MSDLVGNPEDRFSHNEAQIEKHCVLLITRIKQKFNCFDRLKLQTMWFYGNGLKDEDVMANRVGPAQSAMHIITLIWMHTVYPDLSS